MESDPVTSSQVRLWDVMTKRIEQEKKKPKKKDRAWFERKVAELRTRPAFFCCRDLLMMSSLVAQFRQSPQRKRRRKAGNSFSRE